MSEVQLSPDHSAAEATYRMLRSSFPVDSIFHPTLSVAKHMVAEVILKEDSSTSTVPTPTT